MWGKGEGQRDGSGQLWDMLGCVIGCEVLRSWKGGPGVLESRDLGGGVPKSEGLGIVELWRSQDTGGVGSWNCGVPISWGVGVTALGGP